MNDVKSIELDIQELEAMAISEIVDIRRIENQLIVKESETNGEDDYFKWRTSALLAISAKKTNYAAITHQKMHWKSVLKNLNRKNSTARIENTNKILDAKAKKRELHLRNMDAVEKKRAASIKAHEFQQSIDILTFREFKSLVKKTLGDEDYIKLIAAAREAAERITNENTTIL